MGQPKDPPSLTTQQHFSCTSESWSHQLFNIVRLCKLQDRFVYHIDMIGGMSAVTVVGVVLVFGAEDDV